MNNTKYPALRKAAGSIGFLGASIAPLSSNRFVQNAVANTASYESDIQILAAIYGLESNKLREEFEQWLKKHGGSGRWPDYLDIVHSRLAAGRPLPWEDE